jgi:hypothetical protein
MIKTTLNTFQIVRIAGAAIARDPVLTLFAGISSLVFVIAFCGIGLVLHAGRTVERITESGDVRLVDFIFVAFAYMVVSLLVLYVHASLMVAAQHRLEGSYTDFDAATDAVNSRLGVMMGWAAIAATIGLLLKRIASGRFGQRGARIWGETWTGFLVLPVMMSEGSSPFEALRRSSELYDQTWGERAVPNFSFLVGHLWLAVLAVVIAAGLHALTDSAIVWGGLSAVVFLFGAGLLRAIETVFTVDLYYYAVAGAGGYFPDWLLRNAYVAEHARGRWQTSSSSFPSTLSRGNI